MTSIIDILISWFFSSYNESYWWTKSGIVAEEVARMPINQWVDPKKKIGEMSSSTHICTCNDDGLKDLAHSLDHGWLVWSNIEQRPISEKQTNDPYGLSLSMDPN